MRVTSLYLPRRADRTPRTLSAQGLAEAPSFFLLFAAFILACGTTHLMEATIFWWPAYRLAGVIKLITAGASSPQAAAASVRNFDNAFAGSSLQSAPAANTATNPALDS